MVEGTANTAALCEPLLNQNKFPDLATLKTEGTDIDMAEVRRLFDALKFVDRSGQLSTRLFDVVHEMMPSLVSVRRSNEALAPYLAAARSQLRQPGCKGKFSQFLAALGNFPRATADRLADEWEAKHAPPVEPIATGNLAILETDRPEGNAKSGGPPRFIMVDLPWPRDLEKAFYQVQGVIYGAHGRGHRASVLIAQAILDPLQKVAEREAAKRKKGPSAVTAFPSNSDGKAVAHD